MARRKKETLYTILDNNFGIVRLLLMIPITLLLVSFTYQQIVVMDNSINYMTLNSSQISEYDPHITDKFYYSPTNYNGIKVNFNQTLDNSLLECIIGGEYELSFYNKKSLVGESSIKDETRHIIDVPSSAVSSGYDAIVFTPSGGKILYISYIAPLLEYDENLVFQPVPTRELTMSTYYPVHGHSGLVSALYAHTVLADDSSIVLDVISTNNELGSSLLSIVDGNGKTIANFDTNTYLPKYEEGDVSKAYTLKVLSKNYSLSDLYLRYILDYSSEPDLWQINPYVQVDEEIYSSTLMRETDNMIQFPNLNISDDNVVTLNGSNITLDKSLFIPKGYSLQLSAGQSIDLTNNAFILCYDYVNFIGTSSSPISITSSDSSLYSGVVVMKGSEVSTLDYVHFDNLGEVQSGIWKLTGAVTFYESDVVISNSKFSNNRSEDSLNSVRCHIEVYDTLIENTFQDAYDADFCTGVFKNVTFVNSGNDGFDVSTSTFTLYDCVFIDTHDKAISTGENSTVTVYGVEINNAQTGLSAKDLSVLTVDNANITNVFVGICVYQKKPEFGASEVYATNYTLNQPYDFDYIIQKQDTVIVNGQQLIASDNKKQEIIIQRMIEEIEI